MNWKYRGRNRYVSRPSKTQTPKIVFTISKTNLMPGTPWSCDVRVGMATIKFMCISKTVESCKKQVELFLKEIAYGKVA